MKLHSILNCAGLIVALPLALAAQDRTDVSTTPTVPFEQWGPSQGSHEITIGGSGASNKHLDDSFGGVSASYGMFFTDTLEGVVRQSINYSNPSQGGAAWNGSTRIAVDQHFSQGRVRPYAGVSFGGVYGDYVRDTWAAGLEAGVKYYVQPKTFLFAGADYSWFFQHAKSVEERFDDGQFSWGVGMGFNF